MTINAADQPSSAQEAPPQNCCPPTIPPPSTPQTQGSWLLTVTYIGTALILGGLPLVCCTALQDAVQIPKMAVFWSLATLTAASGGLWIFSRQLSWCPRALVGRLGMLSLIWTIVTALLSHNGYNAWPYALQAFLSLGLLIVWSQTLTPQRFWSMLGFTGLSGTLVSLYALLQHVSTYRLSILGLTLRDPLSWSIPHLSAERTIATFGNPNYLGAWQAVMLVLLGAWSLQVKERKWRLLGIGGWIIGAVSLIITQTRGAWVGLAAGLALWVVLAYIRADRSTRRRLLVTAGLLVALTFAFMLGVGHYQASQGHSFNVTQRLHSLTDWQDLSFRTRVYFWGSACNIAMRSPLMGAGPGGQTVASQLDRKMAPLEVSDPPRNVENVHSQYMQTLAETGLPGLAILLVCLLATLYRAITHRSALGQTLAAAACTHWVTQIFICSTISSECLWIFLLSATASDMLEPHLEESPDTLQPRRPLGLAACVTLTAIIVSLAASSLCLISQRTAWLADDCRLYGESMVASRRYPAKQIMPYMLKASALYLQAADQAPVWLQSDQYNLAARTNMYIFAVLTNRQETRYWEKAREYAQTACALRPDWANYKDYLAFVYEHNPTYLAQAQEALQQALALDPYNQDMHFHLARLYAQSREWQKALAECDQCLSSRFPRAYLLRGRILVAMGDTQGALKVEEFIKSQSPDCAATEIHRAIFDTEQDLSAPAPKQDN